MIFYKDNEFHFSDSLDDEQLESAAKEELKFTHAAEPKAATSSNPLLGKYPLQLEGRSNREIFSTLLHSIALEEAAISHFIHAEAGKIEAFTGENGNFPTSPSNRQITEFQYGVTRVMEALVEKQKLLFRMVEMSKQLLEEGEDFNGEERDSQA